VVDLNSVAGKTPVTERHVPLIVVGAGAAGVAAATAAARAGVRVLLLDEHPLDPELMAMDVPLYFGQRMSAAVRDRGAMLERVVRANAALEEAIDAGVEVELGVSVWGAFSPGPTMRALGPCLGVADLSRSWLVGYDRLIVAAGARDPARARLGEGRHDGRRGALTLLTR
jgi:phytoene dehydrogenase-like protein